MQRFVTIGVAACLIAAACNGAEEAGPAAPAPARSSDASTAPPAGSSTPAPAPLWRDATAETIGETLEWTNTVELADIDADGLIGAVRGGSDRLFVNDGSGEFTVTPDVLGNTDGTLGLAAADLNGDDRPDVVEAQGEFATPEKVCLGEGIPPDTAAPIVTNVTAVDGAVHARVHDHKSPSGAHDWREVVVEGPGGSLPMAWYGEHLWRADVPDAGDHRARATDAAGNQTCSDPVAVPADG